MNGKGDGAYFSAAAFCGLVVVAALAPAGCKRGGGPPLEVYADGIDPQLVRFEIDDLGALDEQALFELKKRGDVDGLLALDGDACQGPCRAAMLTIFVENKSKVADAPPVVRLASPAMKPERRPIPYGGKQINSGRIGRTRVVVELWPEETRLTATVSGSVFLDVASGNVPKGSEP